MVVLVERLIDLTAWFETQEPCIIFRFDKRVCSLLFQSSCPSFDLNSHFFFFTVSLNFFQHASLGLWSLTEFFSTKILFFQLMLHIFKFKFQLLGCQLNHSISH